MCLSVVVMTGRVPELQCTHRGCLRWLNEVMLLRNLAQSFQEKSVCHHHPYPHPEFSSTHPISGHFIHISKGNLLHE